MPLPGQVLRQLDASLRSAFPSRLALQRLVRYRLDQRLNEISGGVNLNELTFELIDWAESAGRLEELIVQSLQENPRNPDLRTFVEQHFPNLLTLLVAESDANIGNYTPTINTHPANTNATLNSTDFLPNPGTSRKYEPLGDWLRSRNSSLTIIELTFDEVESHIQGKLPPSALKERTTWWANVGKDRVQSKAWLQAGWRVKQVDVSARKVTFERIQGQASDKA